MFDSNKGITLLTLSITIVIMLILTFTVSVNVTTYVERKQMANLETDITKLKEEIDYYYNKNNELPIINKYTTTNMLEKSTNDNENYFVIDLSKMRELNLNYGKDYEKIIDYTIEISDLADIYIINEQSHTIYYPKGIEHSGKTYYTTINTEDTLIEDIPLSGIEITGTKTGKVDEQIQLTANIVPSFVENTGVTWSSNDETLATVDENGKVTLKSVGTVTITATSKDDETIKDEYEMQIGMITGDLKSGDYIKYNTGVTSVGENGVVTCRVLYEDSSEYGLQIITDKSITDVRLGVENDTTWETGKTAYNNAITKLNSEAEKYINTNYVIDARCVGSIPIIDLEGKMINKNNENTTNVQLKFVPKGWTTKDSGCKGEDDNYEIDYGTMQKIGSTGINNTGQIYWLASRHLNSYDTGCGFRIRNVDETGTQNVNGLCYVLSDGSSAGGSIAHGLRACFSMITSVKIISGNGTSETTAYELE